jgi:hypothetical protein
MITHVIVWPAGWMMRFVWGCGVSLFGSGLSALLRCARGDGSWLASASLDRTVRI